MLRAMRHVLRTVAAIRVAVSTRRDLLLDILALRLSFTGTPSASVRVDFRSGRTTRSPRAADDRIDWPRIGVGLPRTSGISFGEPGAAAASRRDETYERPSTSTGLLFHAGGDGKLRVYDAETGQVLWTTTMPAGSRGIPSMYEVNGRQFFVVNVTSKSSPVEGRALAQVRKWRRVSSARTCRMRFRNSGLIAATALVAMVSGCRRPAAGGNPTVKRSDAQTANTYVD